MKPHEWLVVVVLLVVLLGSVAVVGYTEAKFEARLRALEATVGACCSTEYRDADAEAWIVALGKLRKRVDELASRLEVLER